MLTQPSTKPETFAAHLDALEEVLDQEFDALKRTDAEALMDCSQRKLVILDAIARTHRAIDDVSEAGRSAAHPDTVQAGLSQRLRDLSSRNQRNGLLIAGCRRQTRRALDILTGGDRSDGVYDPRAELPATDLGRSLGRA